MTKILFLLFLLPCFLLAQVEVSVPANVEVMRKAEYTLYDFIVLKEGNSEDLESFKKVSVSFLTKKGILEAIKENDLKTKVIFEDGFKVVTTSQVSRGELQRKINNHLTGECNVCIFEIQIHKVPLVNESSVTFRATDFDISRGSFMLSLAEGAQTGRVYTTGSWRTFRKVPVSNKWLGQGHRVTNDDLKEELKEVTFLNNKLIDAQDLVGKQLSRSIAANTIITRDILTIEKMVKKGDVVRLLIKDGPFEIETSAQAESDGLEGDSVKVKTNQKSVTAKVVSKDKVVSE